MGKAPNTKNVLVIGDIHEPFSKEGYREFCIDTYNKYNCTHAIFIGDIIDHHALSYHETDPDGLSAGNELDLAIKHIGKWYKAFPHADVVIGNHDRMVMRKAFSGGIPRRWIVSFKEVLGTPDWNFTEELTYHSVRYIHGDGGGTAKKRAKEDLISTVQGHYHSQAYTEHFVGENFRIFGMQVGCGINRKTYAMAYAKAGAKPAIGCGLVLFNGSLPINILMKL